jgi:hypothetical protein
LKDSEARLQSNIQPSGYDNKKEKSLCGKRHMNIQVLTIIFLGSFLSFTKALYVGSTSLVNTLGHSIKPVVKTLQE